MDAISDLKVFVSVAEDGGLSAAGRRLGLSPPAVSHRLNKLEERLGVRLMHRSTRQVTLTEEGRAYFERASKILLDLEEMDALVGQKSPVVRGLLRVTVASCFAARQIVPYLPELLGRYPELRVDLDSTDRYVDIVESGHDMAIRVGRPVDSSLIVAKLADNRRVLVAAPSYLGRRGRPGRAADLEQHDCLALPWQSEWRLREDAGEVLIRPKGSIVSNSVDVLRDAAIAGLGIAIKSLWEVGDDVRAGRLELVLDGHLAGDEAPVHALYPSRNHLPQRVRAFIAFLREKYSQTPCWVNPGC